MERFDLVEKAYNELVAEGKIFPTATQFEEQKALLTRRAAYYLNQVDSNLGLLAKTSGNNIQGFSVDIILNKNGDYWDVATDTSLGGPERLAKPVDGATQHDESLIPRWVKPLPMWCDFPVVEDPTVPPSTPPDTPPDDILTLDKLFNELVDALVNRLSPELTELHARLLTLEQKLDSTHAKVGEIKSCIFRR